MGFSPLADMSRRIPDLGRSAPRQSAVTGVALHQNAGINAWGEASNPRREVSANYWIANDGTIIPNIDETRRAFTSGAAGYPAGGAADHRNITFEISNSPEGVRSGTWAISAEAWAAVVYLIADIYTRYGLGAVTRGPSRGVGVHQDWVPTSCPGPYIMGHLGQIISEAEAIRSGGSPTPPQPIILEDDDMNTYLEATSSSTPIKEADGVERSRIWAGERQIGGMTFASVWERSPDGSIRRLFKGEWEAIVAAHAAADRKVPVAKVGGNVVEQIVFGKRA